MFYVIQKGSKFFSGGGSYVNTGGLCSTPTWVDAVGEAFGTSSLEDAEAIAKRYGGKPMPFKG